MIRLNPFDIAFNVLYLVFLCVLYPLIVALIAYLLEKKTNPSATR